MRNLKKLLSVVLVVAMIAGLCAVGSFSAAAAEYSEVTNYKQAAAVVSGIGIINGYEDGTMQYDKAVTREEAAKIICVALVGSDTVANLKTGTAPFADVAANRWSAPYISYLKAQGIVNGKTATQFDPTAEVTAVEFAKMMLCAAGYGKANEFVGASWDVNTIATANTYGVFDSTLATDLTAPATREQCMLYTFNAITRVPTVSYNSTFNSYYTGTSVMNGSGSKVTDVNVGDATDPDYKTTLAYTKFKLVKTVDGIDDYGRPAATWAIEGGKVISDAVESQVAAYTLNGTVANSTIYNTLGASVAKNLNKNIWNDAGNGSLYANAENLFEVYKNGVKLTGGAYPVTAALAGNSFTANAVSGNGDVIEIYVDNVTAADLNSTALPANTVAGDYKVRVVVTSEFFGQVTAVNANQLTVKVLSSNGNAIFGYTDNKYDVTVKAADVNISGFAKKDYVLLNISDPGTSKTNKVTKISAAKDPVVGTYNGNDGMSQLVVDGKGVPSSAVVAFAATTSSGNFTSDNQYNFWYDSLGNIIYAELYKDSGSVDMTKYAFVKNIRYNADAKYDFAFEVQLVYSDGSVEWVPYVVDGNTGAYKFNGITYYLKVSGVNYDVYTDSAKTAPLGSTLDTQIMTPATGAFYSFTKADNKVVLKAIDPTFATANYAFNAVKLDSKTGVTQAAYSSNSNTKVAIVDGAGNVVTLAGESKFNDTTYTGYALYTYAKDSKKINNLFIYSTSTITSTAKAFFVKADGYDSNYGYVNLCIDGNFVNRAKVDLSAYFGIAYGSAKVYDVTIAGDIYTLSPVTGGTAINNASLATSTNLGAYGYYEIDKFSVTHHYAWAQIAELDGHAFWTATADAGTKESGNYTGSPAVNAVKYYYDSSTVIYDCRTNPATFAIDGKVVTTLEEGEYFIAITDNTGSNAFSSTNYCKYIWIVD